MWDIYRPLYAMSRPLGVVNRADYLCRLATGKRVLHVGCAAAPLSVEALRSPTFLHRRLVMVAAVCHGVDSDAEASNMLREAGFTNIRTADATKLSQLVDDRYDLIVLGEVLEHVGNAGLFLAEMPKLLAEDGKIVITVPNAYNFLRFIQMMVGREVVHMDHVAYYSPKTLSAACARVGLALETLAFTDPFRELPAASNHRVLAGVYGTMLRLRPYFGQSVVGVFRAAGSHQTLRHCVVA